MKAFLFKSIFILAGIFAFLSDTAAQTWSVAAGWNINHYINIPKKDFSYISEYQSRQGYSMRVNYEQIIKKYWKIRAGLGVDQVTNDLHVSRGGRGGGVITEADLKKNVLSLCFFPFVTEPIKNLGTGLGTRFSFLIKDYTTGTEFHWQSGVTPSQNDLSDPEDQINPFFTMGVEAFLNYRIRLGRHWSILPEYSATLGITEETKNLESPAKLVQQRLCLVLAYTI